MAWQGLSGSNTGSLIRHGKGGATSSQSEAGDGGLSCDRQRPWHELRQLSLLAYTPKKSNVEPEKRPSID